MARQITTDNNIEIVPETTNNSFPTPPDPSVDGITGPGFMKTVKTAIEEIDSKLGTISTDISTEISDAITPVSNKANQNESDISNLDNRVTSAESDITNLSNEISNSILATTEIAPANGSTTDLSNNVRYVVNASAGSITLRLPAIVADVTTAISIMCDGVNSFESNNFTLSGNGNNIIVKNADGSYEAAATSIDINTNADFNITKSGSNYILRGGII